MTMRKPKSYATFAFIIAALTITTVAFAFSRNLTGSWTTPSGSHVAIIHNTSTGQAVFSVLFTGPLHTSSLDYHGSVVGNSGSTEFIFHGVADDIAFQDNDATCTISGLEMLTQGQVLGQFPERSLRMTGCFTVGRARCVMHGGTVKTFPMGDTCDGIWR